MSENNETERRFFSAVSLERAVLEAARYYDLTPEELGYEVVDKKQGMMKRRKVFIRVDPAAPRAPAPEERAAPVRPPSVEPVPATAVQNEPSVPPVQAPRLSSSAIAEPLGSERPLAAVASPPPAAAARERIPPDVDSLRGTPGGQWVDLPDSIEDFGRRRPRASQSVDAAARAGLELLFRLAGLRFEIQVYQGTEGVEVELSGPDSERILEDEGQVLRALEHLLPRLMLQDLGEVVLCAIDCDGFQVLREERLRSRAQRAAAEARGRGSAETLEPMHPADRRVVHLALADDATVTTESVGRGYFRRVTVRPV